MSMRVIFQNLIMEKLQHIYKVLVLVSLAMYLIWTFFRNLFWDYYSDEMQSLLGVTGYGSVIPWTEQVFAFLLFINILCYVGLLLLRKWAIWLLIGVDVVVLLVLAPFGGVEVSSPIERISGSILLLSDGAIISLALFSELKSRFR